MTNLNDYEIGHNLPYWRFYRSLEEDLEKCFKYVNPSVDQFTVYSDEFAKIILVASSEFENVIKEIKAITGFAGEDKIHGYYKCISDKYPNFMNMELIMPRYSIRFRPISDWTETQSPDWWRQGYNKIKHRRIEHPKAANLIRAIGALGSLQIVLLHFYRLKFDPILFPIAVAPNLIEPVKSDSISFFDSGFIGWEWTLPDDPTP